MMTESEDGYDEGEERETARCGMQREPGGQCEKVCEWLVIEDVQIGWSMSGFVRSCVIK